MCGTDTDLVDIESCDGRRLLLRVVPRRIQFVIPIFRAGQLGVIIEISSKFLSCVLYFAQPALQIPLNQLRPRLQVTHGHISPRQA